MTKTATTPKPIRASSRPALASPKPETTAQIEDKAARRPREFNRTQEIIIDAVSDMLTAGGHQDSLDALVMACADHYTRRVWTSLINDPNKLDERLREQRAGLEPEWRFNLQVAIRVNKRLPEPKRIEPSDVSARIREAVREDVMDYFAWFLEQASWEEMHFMNDVLLDWSSRHHHPDFGADEVYLASAFEETVRRDNGWMKVPKDMAEQMQAYLNALRAVEGKV